MDQIVFILQLCVNRNSKRGIRNMSKVEVLVATMHQPKGDYSLLERLNIQSDAVVVNQSDRDELHTFVFQQFSIMWIDSSDRGLSRSRNLALQHARGDICVICDDDERLCAGYPAMIENAYESVPQAEFIAFNITKEGSDEVEKPFAAPEKIGFFKTYSSVHITFLRKNIIDAQISFDTRFGSGSGMYSCAEDAIFCMDCHKSKLQMYTFPGYLCSVNCEQSTWFRGFDEKYFYDVGAYLSNVFPHIKTILKWYYPWRCRYLTELSTFQIVSAIHDGFRGYRREWNYAQYVRNKSNKS